MKWTACVEATSTLTEHLLHWSLSQLVGCHALHQDCHCQIDHSKKTVQQVFSSLGLCFLAIKISWRPLALLLLRGWNFWECGEMNQGPWRFLDNRKLPVTVTLTRNRKKFLMRVRWIWSPEWAEDYDACWTNKQPLRSWQKQKNDQRCEAIAQKW